MENEEYLATQMTIIQLGRVTSTLKLNEFIEQISKAETVVPMLDPTLYKKAGDNLQSIKELAKTLLPVAKAFGKCFDAMTKTAVSPDLVVGPKPTA